MEDLLESIDARGVATLTLNRLARRNALDEALVLAMTQALRRLDSRSDARIVVLTGGGPVFCAGGDIQWMMRMATGPQSGNEADALALARLLRVLDGLSKPTIALVQGPAYGGGVGLVACCDIAIAADCARFSLSEVRLGIAPGVVGPFVLRSIGARMARRFVLTAEEMSAEDALGIGLVHQVVPLEQLPMARDRTVDALLRGAPGAQAEAKALMAFYEGRVIDDELMKEAALRLAARRASPEGREGLKAFIEKRPPAWRAAR
ncbi:MAG: enoyl-CoA hydratase-related protein [Methylocystis sp.]|nr:enoyl-CoA hydratase-related protein [Methylocystis sp.]